MLAFTRVKVNPVSVWQWVAKELIPEKIWPLPAAGWWRPADETMKFSLASIPIGLEVGTLFLSPAIYACEGPQKGRRFLAEGNEPWSWSEKHVVTKENEKYSLSRLADRNLAHHVLELDLPLWGFLTYRQATLDRVGKKERVSSWSGFRKERRVQGCAYDLSLASAVRSSEPNVA